MRDGSRFLVLRVQATVAQGQALVARGLQEHEHRGRLQGYAGDLDHLAIALRQRSGWWGRRQRQAAALAETEAARWRRRLAGVAG